MLAELLLSDWPALQLDTVRIEGDVITLETHSTAAEASCPVCGQPSDQVHSCYTRHPHGLSIASKRVQWQLHVRCFRCLTLNCVRNPLVVGENDGVVLYRRRANQDRVGLVLGSRARHVDRDVNAGRSGTYDKAKPAWQVRLERQDIFLLEAFANPSQLQECGGLNTVSRHPTR